MPLLAGDQGVVNQLGKWVWPVNHDGQDTGTEKQFPSPVLETNQNLAGFWYDHLHQTSSISEEWGIQKMWAINLEVTLLLHSGQLSLQSTLLFLPLINVRPHCLLQLLCQSFVQDKSLEWISRRSSWHSRPPVAIVLEPGAQIIWQEKEIEVTQIEKEEVKLAVYW